MSDDAAWSESKDVAPAWFVDALAQKPEIRQFDVGGARLQCRCWNLHETSKPGLLLVHGYRGHARWWDFVAPYFTQNYRVVAMDLSGMGDSEWRDEYSLAGHAAEVVAVIAECGLEHARVVGHSYGGGRVLRACAEFPGVIEHALIVDSWVVFKGEPAPFEPRRVGNPEPYPDYASARARFRLIPAQTAETYLVDYIARHSLQEVNGGWTWKFDPRLRVGMPEPDGAAMLERIQCKVHYLYGERSRIVDAAQARRVTECLRHGHTPVAILEAGHHIMLDQPLALVSALRALLC